MFSPFTPSFESNVRRTHLYLDFYFAPTFNEFVAEHSRYSSECFPRDTSRNSREEVLIEGQTLAPLICESNVERNNRQDASEKYLRTVELFAE